MPKIKSLLAVFLFAFCALASSGNQTEPVFATVNINGNSVNISDIQPYGANWLVIIIQSEQTKEFTREYISTRNISAVIVKKKGSEIYDIKAISGGNAVIDIENAPKRIIDRIFTYLLGVPYKETP
jgi:hypothetical protein